METTRQRDRPRPPTSSWPRQDHSREVTGPAPGLANHLLSALSAADYARVAPLLTYVALDLKQVLYEPNAVITHAYFPLRGVVSMVNTMDEGSVEVGNVGSEGLIGVPLLNYADSMPTLVIVQVLGEAHRMSAADFQTVVRDHEGVRRLFYRYAQTLLDQVAQSAACNRLHSLEARCARWLLMTHDRVGADRGIDAFALTQEFLSYMLGVHRPAVTLAARTLQKAGIIEYARGTITVTDRAGLENAACGCYGITRRAFTKLLG